MGSAGVKKRQLEETVWTATSARNLLAVRYACSISVSRIISFRPSIVPHPAQILERIPGWTQGLEHGDAQQQVDLTPRVTLHCPKEDFLSPVSTAAERLRSLERHLPEPRWRRVLLVVCVIGASERYPACLPPLICFVLTLQGSSPCATFAGGRAGLARFQRRQVQTSLSRHLSGAQQVMTTVASPNAF